MVRYYAFNNIHCCRITASQMRSTWPIMQAQITHPLRNDDGAILAGGIELFWRGLKANWRRTR